MEILNKRMTELDISEIDLDEEANRVVIFLNQMNEEKINHIKDLVDVDTVEFKHMDLKFKLL